MRKPNPKRMLTRKAVKATARHSAKGATAKVRRRPARAVTLIGIGAFAGLLVGWFAGRRDANGDAADPAPPLAKSPPVPGPATKPEAEPASA